MQLDLDELVMGGRVVKRSEFGNGQGSESKEAKIAEKSSLQRKEGNKSILTDKKRQRSPRNRMEEIIVGTRGTWTSSRSNQGTTTRESYTISEALPNALYGTWDTGLPNSCRRIPSGSPQRPVNDPRAGNMIGELLRIAQWTFPPSKNAQEWE